MRPSRVMVTGNAGAGKSTLAHRLGAILSLPVFGLDQIVWQPGWQKTPWREKNATLSALAQRPVWVIEGVSPIIEAQADMVIFLDVAPILCTWRCAKRNWRYLLGSRPGLPASCPEVLIVPRLLKIIWGFNRNVRPRILAAIADSQRSQHYRHVLTARDRLRVLEELRCAAQPPPC